MSNPLPKLTEERRAELQRQIEQEKARKRELVERLLQSDLLDEDGYPTEAALQIIENWDLHDPRGWFEFIESIWHLKSWGWSKQREPHDWDKERMVDRWYISTAGWSGNESIIRAMEKTDWLWHMHWEQSRRGGHYIFQVDVEDEQ